jgi:hypothetical protein
MDTQAAVLSDGSINLDRLITEIQSDLFNDAKYKAEDGMKKRAVHISEFQIILCLSSYPYHRQSAILFILMNPLFLISFLFHTPMEQVRTMMNSRRLLPAHN